MLTATLNPKPCAHCGSSFTPARPLQRVCSPICAARIIKAKNSQERAQFKERKAKLKPRSKWLAEAQAVCNRYVRLRDMAKGYGCISCGSRPDQKYGGSMDAGHWRSVGSAPHLRFYLPQIALQCVKCNRYLGGNAVEMRKGLVERLGLERVEEIASMQHVAKFDIEYLQRFKSVMGKKLRRLEKRMA